MNENLLYGLLVANLLLCYLIGLRVRNIQRDVERVHDFVYALVHHPVVAMLSTIPQMMEEEEDSDQVPAPFKEWDES